MNIFFTIVEKLAYLQKKINLDNKDHNQEQVDIKKMVEQGTINILAMGYKGVESWRKARAKSKKINDEKKD